MTFKVLRVPYLVRKEILENMGFIELLLLAHASKRMKTLIKQELKVRNHMCRIQFQKDIQIGFFNKKDGNVFEIITFDSTKKMPRNKKFGHMFSNSAYNTPMLKTIWRDAFDGAQEIFKELTDIFDIPLRDFHIGLDETKLDYKAIVRWVDQLTELPENASFSADNCNSQDIAWIIENSEASNEMRLDSRKITNKTIRKCLQKLKSGCNSELEELNFLTHREADLPTILDGLEVTEEESGWSFRLDNGDKCTVFDVGFGVDVILGVQVRIERS